jgi:hypothetical protein
LHPPDYLIPIWRQMPGNSGVFTIGLDPREAEFVLERGWALLDGVRYRASTEGCDPNLQGDGRIMVRCDMPEQQPVAELDTLDRWGRLRRMLRLAA